MSFCTSFCELVVLIVAPSDRRELGHVADVGVPEVGVRARVVDPDEARPTSRAAGRRAAALRGGRAGAGRRGLGGVRGGRAVSRARTAGTDEQRHRHPTGSENGSSAHSSAFRIGWASTKVRLVSGAGHVRSAFAASYGDRHWMSCPTSYRSGAQTGQRAPRRRIMPFLQLASSWLRCAQLSDDLWGGWPWLHRQPRPRSARSAS